MMDEVERAEKFLDEFHDYPVPVVDLAEAFKEHAMQKRNGVVAFTPYQLAKYAETVREEQMEKLAGWMLASGIATGHGDTINDLLAELTQHLNETVHKAEESQRRMDLDAANDALSDLNILPSQKEDVLLAISNAT